MTLTASQAQALKDNISQWIEQSYPAEHDCKSSKQASRKISAVEFINGKLERWCVENNVTIHTLQTLRRNFPEAVPTAGHDRNGARCDILIAWLNFETEPGSSLDTLPPIPDTVAPASPREIVLRETYDYLKMHPSIDEHLKRRCKRIIKQAIENQNLTMEEAFILKMGVRRSKETIHKTRMTMLLLEKNCPTFYRLCVMDTLFDRIRLKLEPESQPTQLNTSSSLKLAFTFMDHWRRTPQSDCKDSLFGCFGDWVTVMDKDSQSSSLPSL